MSVLEQRVGTTPDLGQLDQEITQVRRDKESAIDAQDTLAFSVLQDVRPMIETLPLEKAPEAFARMMDGKARFRMVLVNGKN